MDTNPEYIETHPSTDENPEAAPFVRSPDPLYLLSQRRAKSSGHFRRRPTELPAAKKLLPLSIDFVQRRRAVLNSNGELVLQQEMFRAMEEVTPPPKPVTIVGTTSWCKSVTMKQQLKLLIPKSCNADDSMPLMPSMSYKHLGSGQHIIRDRDKIWRLDSFRKFFAGRGSVGRNTTLWRMKHTDFYGTDVVKWIDGFPLRQSLLHMESRMISNDYSLCAVHGMGITGRVYNEGEARVPKFLQITVHTPGDCGKYQIRVMVSELPDLLADEPSLLLPGRKKEMCKALIKLCYFEYSKSDPVVAEVETPLFGGWGRDKYVPPQVEGEQEDENGEGEEGDINADEELDSKPKEVVTDLNGNIIIRGKDNKDHLMRPDLMKVLLISRGNKLNRRERRENWLEKRTSLREEGKLPATPRPPPVPLRKVDQKFSCGIRLQGISFYVTVYCFPDRPGNYQFYLLNPETGTKLSLKMGKFDVAKLVGEKRPHRFWTKSLEKSILSDVVKRFEAYTWQPLEAGQPLQMGFKLGHRKSIQGMAYRRTKEAKARSARRSYTVNTSSRKAVIARKSEKFKRRIRLARECVHGTRLYIGVVLWGGIRFIFEVYIQAYYKHENYTVMLYKTGQPTARFEILWRDFESFLKDTHTLELLAKARKKMLKKKWQRLGYGGNEKEIWGEAMRLLFGDRLKLLDPGVEPNPRARCVDHMPIERPKRTKKSNAEELPGDSDDGFDSEAEDVDEFGLVIREQSFKDQDSLANVSFCDRNIQYNRAIYSRWVRVNDMRLRRMQIVDESEESDGEEEDIGGKEEGKDTEDSAKETKGANSEDEDSEDEDDDGEEFDLKSEASASARASSDDSSDFGSDDMDEDAASVYLHVTIHQRAWRLYVVAYDPLLRKYYYPKMPETLSRSMSAEIRRLDKPKRMAVLGITIASMIMTDAPEGFEGVLGFGDGDGAESSSSEDSS